ncbi:hypothetical protein N7474_000172 [Penicillium riverlandense]|uniref:uncharacterized protein n=1 Tax=Penicillium riverlandense TaxID=1903569 RepID=UPI002547F850|nr:uncharacterized protein N7474_000172 [Penicillium riverlandense]KAJ5831861.1 hypothetical protein N7474_000172 [Penicillium riverlandense]
MTTTEVPPGKLAPIDRKAEAAVVEEKEWKEREEEKMLNALQEALDCTKCRIAVTETSMATDIDSGIYITTHYPPFFTTNHTRDEFISPLDNATRPKDPTYWNRISVSQREQYYEQVETKLNSALSKHPTPDAELAVLFAHYQVDYHIRQHYLSRSSVLTLCRDAEDMHQLRRWQWDMADADGTAPSSAGCSCSWPNQCRHWGWIDDRNLMMMHQTAMWRRAWRERRRRLKEVRARWAIIMEERRRQRELLRIRQKATLAVATLTVKVYCRGELWDVRQMERFAEDGNVKGRLARSLGV